jgi:hypothetical protein
MSSYPVWLIVLSSLVFGSAAGAGRGGPSVQPNATQQASTPGDLVLVGRVQAVHPPRLLTVEHRLAEQRQVLVLLPEGATMPPTGALIQARGALRRVDKAEVGASIWSAIEARAQETFAGRQILIADTVEPATESAERATRPALIAQAPSGSRPEITVRPEALASLISELAGFQVRVPYARVVGLFDSRSLIIDSAMNLRPPLGHRDRVLVLVDSAALRVPAEQLVASTVTVQGVARTLLGMQVSGEVPWPAQLDRDAVKRLEVRAAVLATSIRTADGVELTNR